MTLVNSDRPFSKVIIGPVRMCGYVCLINGSKEKEANCKVVTVELNGAIRIILYSHKKIAKGNELRYNYDPQSEFEASSLNKYEKKIASSKINTKSKRKENNKKYNIISVSAKCGLKNLGNTCYL